MTPNPETIARSLVSGYIAQYPQEAARELEASPPEEIAGVLARQPAPAAAAVLQRLVPQTAAEVVGALADDAFRSLAPELDPARVASLLARLPEEERARRLDLLEQGTAGELRQLMSYPSDAAGAIMDPAVAALRPDSTAKDARALLRRLRRKRLQHIYVIDEEGRPVGAVPVHELAVADASERLADLSSRPPPTVQATASSSEAADLFQRHRITGLPVTDFDGRLIGIIRHDALLTAFEEEASADIQTMVGASKDERALSTPLFAVRKRLPWLQINLGTAFLAAFVVGLFEGTIARYTALAVLLPIAAGQSGNTGAQALAVTMRGLALREVRLRHWFGIARKELAVGFINGLAVAVVTAAAVYLWSRSPGLALVIGSAMVISMVIAGIAGASVPMVLTVFGQDPAQSSSIILTTVTDIVGFMSFLGLATLAAGLL